MSQNVAYVVPTNYNVEVGRAYASKYFGLGVAQIFLGVLSIIFGIASVAYVSDSYGKYGYSGADFFAISGSGIWCGVFFVVSGILGVVSGRKPHYCPIVAAMVMTIFSALAACTLLGYQLSVSAIAGGRAEMISDCIRNGRRYPCSYYSYKYKQKFFTESFLEYLKTLTGLHATTSVFAFAALVISIVHSAYCCAATCCRNGNQMPVQVIQQHHAVVPQPCAGIPPGQQVFVQQYPVTQQASMQPPMYTPQVSTVLPPGQQMFYVTQGQQGVPVNPGQQKQMNYTANNNTAEKALPSA